MRDHTRDAGAYGIVTHRYSIYNGSTLLVVYQLKHCTGALDRYVSDSNVYCPTWLAPVVISDLPGVRDAAVILRVRMRLPRQLVRAMIDLQFT